MYQCIDLNLSCYDVRDETERHLTLSEFQAVQHYSPENRLVEITVDSGLSRTDGLQ